MDLFGILAIVLILILIIEMSKHFLFKTITKIVFIMIILSVIFLIIISSLKSENLLKTDNKLINTGAAVADKIQEQDIFYKIKEKISDIKEDIFQKDT